MRSMAALLNVDAGDAASRSSAFTRRR